MEGEIRITGRLTDCRPVEADADGRAVVGLTATVTADAGPHAVYHVTFPPTRDLAAWVAAVYRAWEEAQTRRAELVNELPAWMRPRPGKDGLGAQGLRSQGLRSQGLRTQGLRITLRGELRCGKAIPPTGVRPATILVRHVTFPGLDGQTIARAEQLFGLRIKN